MNQGKMALPSPQTQAMFFRQFQPALLETSWHPLLESLTTIHSYPTSIARSWPEYAVGRGGVRSGGDSAGSSAGISRSVRGHASRTIGGGIVRVCRRRRRAGRSVRAGRARGRGAGTAGRRNLEGCRIRCCLMDWHCPAMCLEEYTGWQWPDRRQGVRG